ncbi:MAG: 4-hydroxythreonine-4-phosphate dehydrogenase PdxA [Zoogloeaceae bacterium]|nr:4-hydroxythreonine-4-phosphate dehydrogenase PdxA [Zoogloeaceae bacterium]
MSNRENRKAAQDEKTLVPPKSPLVAVTSGEPAGIGPDLCLALAQEDCGARVIVLADRHLLAERARQLGLVVTLRDYQPGAAVEDWQPGCLTVWHHPLARPVVPGVLDAANSGYVIDLLDTAIAACRSGVFAAMVTAPIHKSIIEEAALPRCPRFRGHTDYLAEQTGTPRVVMMLAGETANAHPDGALRVALATTHLPLKEVAAAITREMLTETLRILATDLRHKYGFAQPRILVAGLNPHAGEGGHMGREEIDILLPVLDALRQEGMTLLGPLPADTLFTPPILAQGDAVLAMYHDQGLAPLKYATFGRGVNVTLGLPIVRTSVDHGTALDRAGTGAAHPQSLFAALRESCVLADGNAALRAEKPCQTLPQ